MIFALIIAGLALFVAAELLYAKHNGQPVAVPDIPRKPVVIGQGEALRYAIMGDSTAVGQGGEYGKGFAAQSARFLAENNQVTYQNFAISGATLADIRREQLEAAIAFKPDVVLLAAGANDVMHRTAPSKAAEEATKIFDALQQANPDINIIFTGSPEMGSIPRFPQPLRYFAELRTRALNTELFKAASRKGVTIAPIAKETGPLFKQNPGLFAADKFHPNNDGYATWIPVIKRALEKR